MCTHSDINECLTDNGGCQHNCHDSDGNYTCSCSDDYQLNSDRQTCQGTVARTHQYDTCSSHSQITETNLHCDKNNILNAITSYLALRQACSSFFLSNAKHAVSHFTAAILSQASTNVLGSPA